MILRLGSLPGLLSGSSVYFENFLSFEANIVVHERNLPIIPVFHYSNILAGAKLRSSISLVTILSEAKTPQGRRIVHPEVREVRINMANFTPPRANNWISFGGTSYPNSSEI